MKSKNINVSEANKLSKADLIKLLLKVAPKNKITKINQDIKKTNERKGLRETLAPVKEHMRQNINPNEVFVEDEDEEKARVQHESALEEAAKYVTWNHNKTIITSPRAFYNTIIGNEMIENINENMKNNNIKIKLVMKATFKKPSVEGVINYAHIPVSSEIHIITASSEVPEIISKMLNEIQTTIEEFQVRGSGWIIEAIKHMVLEIVVYKPYKGSSYIELPDEIKNKKACINVKNKDDKCFMWAVLAGLHTMPQYRVNDLVIYENDYNFKCLEYPVECKDSNYKKFESKNINIALSVYLLNEKNMVSPLYVSQKRDAKHRIKLLLIVEEGKSHYVLIKDLSRLLANSKSCKVKLHYCEF